MRIIGTLYFQLNFVVYLKPAQKNFLLGKKCLKQNCGCLGRKWQQQVQVSGLLVWSRTQLGQPVLIDIQCEESLACR